MIELATVTITRTYLIHPDPMMKQVLDRNMDYRRWCWNKALEIWNDMYEARDIMLPQKKRLLIKDYYQILHSLDNKKLKAKTKQKKQDQLLEIGSQLTATDWELAKINPSPNWRNVRDQMVADKMQWQLKYSARILQLAVQDLGKAFSNFFNQAQPGWGKPKFKSRFALRQGFKSDCLRIKDEMLYLDQPRGNQEKWTPFSVNEPLLSNKFGVVSFYRERNQYFVTIPFKVEQTVLKTMPKSNKVTGVDRNVGHFDTLDGSINVDPKRLERLYQRVKHYQRSLAKKRKINGRIKGKRSKNYQKTREKLQRTYHRIHDIQHDLMHKFTTLLVQHYQTLVIEDLNVKGMQMSHVASKGLHRSMFGLFTQLITYKCNWYHRNLILTNRFYPSTQRCAYCGTIKTGDDKITLQGNKKHHTKHNEYVCYNPNCPKYNVVRDRDYNAVQSLTAIALHPEINHKY